MELKGYIVYSRQFGGNLTLQLTNLYNINPLKFGGGYVLYNDQSLDNLIIKLNTIDIS